MEYLTIGRVAEATGCKIQTIRYYEEIGLLPPAPRTAGNQRLYDRKAVGRLSFIRHSRELGFSLDAIRDLLDLSENPEQSCSAADSIARNRLSEVESRISRLTALKHELERMIDQCDGGRIADCRVIEVLGDHDKCLAEHPPAETPTAG
jgi:Cu(I)-responsive transcriptional regulator